MANIVIVGRGPAGISAALYTLRAGISTTVIGKDNGTLGKVDKIENYYGFPDPISGSNLVQTGIEQAKRLGADFVEDEVVGISYDGRLIVKTTGGEYPADALILATGSTRSAPRIKGLQELEGHGVSYCAVCDGFFYRGKEVAVLGNGDYAIHEALELLNTSKSVTVLTNGKKMLASVPEGIQLCTKEIHSLDGDPVLNQVRFQDGSSLNAEGVFVAMGVAGSTDLARKLGAEVDNNKIVVDENMSTNIPGLYAAGDCTGGLLQIAKAVYEGAKAGTEAIKFVRAAAKAAKV
ncbi:NAD(P)/FAD-dependent oxidoreductase [Clostridium minihomine]|uniref:NAD(P)/FAD-dependent oxidoreductase n=1 Tax=Clostridium minihomine TaxID=2045012 RepID=UPI000C7759F4|nr:NAD(P)/FAD-dependent oxidoreductase [Clostridium minihomine]